MTHYRTEENAARVTLAIDDDLPDEDVLVHVRCAEANPETVHPFGGDYTFEDGATCAICGEDLTHD